MSTEADRQDTVSASPAGVIDANVVFMTHYIPLYQVRVLQEIAAAVRQFQVLLSTPLEPNRDFRPDWSGLDVSVQKCLTVRRNWKHRSAGFRDPLFVHVPYDTSARLRKINPDVILSLELGARSAGAARFCRRNPSTKLILCTYMSTHTEQGRGWLRRRLRGRLIKSADAITFNGPSCEQYLKQLDAPEQKLFHLPYAADDRNVAAVSVERDEAAVRHRLLCVGQLTERKGVELLVKSLVRYCSIRPDRKVAMTFAGDGPLRQRLAATACPLNLRLTFLGNVPASDLAELMNSHGGVVAPTLADEWLLVVNEALRGGLPVIGSCYAQAVETLIREGVNGWSYDPLVPGDLDEKLDSYFATSEAGLVVMRGECVASVRQRTPAWAAAGAVDAIRSVLPAVVASPEEDGANT